MKLAFITLLLLINASLSAAEVYKWVDEQGIVHFSDDITRVPERYRQGIQKIGVDEEKANATEPESGTPQSVAGRVDPEWSGVLWRERHRVGGSHPLGRDESHHGEATTPLGAP